MPTMDAIGLTVSPLFEVDPLCAFRTAQFACPREDPSDIICSFNG